MLKTLTCLTIEHDLRVALVAALICLGGSFTSFKLYARMGGARGHVRAAWLLLTSLISGAAVWATHFVALVAYQPGLPTGYSPSGTLLSLIVAVMFMGGGFVIAATERSRTNDVAGGLILGVGIAAMHYVGMSAFVTQGHLTWEAAGIGASVFVGVVGAICALTILGQGRSLKRQILASAAFTLAVCGLHFVGMGAITITPDPAILVSDQLLSGGVLTLAVTTIAVLIFLGGLGAVAIETQTTRSALVRIRRMANAAYEGIVVIQNDRINDANAAFCELAGASLEQLRGQKFYGQLLTLDGEEALAEGVRREGLLRPLDNGREIPIELFARLMDDGARAETSGLTVLAVRDLRERRSAEEKIRYLADHDGLTGLMNRRSLQARLASALERVEATAENLTVICIDLDHFKEANDQFGHHAGDHMLVEAARRINSIVSLPSFAGRLGGDEFIVAQLGSGDAAAAAAQLATQLLEALGEPVVYDGQELFLGASLGVSLFPDDGRTVESLMANADMALYRAKEGGRGIYRFFKREMDDTIRERRTMARELRQGILDDELVVHYQPLASGSTGEICGFEALVRWNHPTRGMVPPLEFIPVAEENGLIAPLGEWVLRRACADAAAWPKPLRIAVNLSPLQLNNPSLPTLVHEILVSTGLSPYRLELEITESALFQDYQRALDNLRRLKALGVRIAMDDFGTGFSSLSTLQSFPFDKIKIDKSFVENINRHDRATVIVRAVLGLGRSLEIPVVAEGVETDDQIAFLRAENCAELQGYAIGRPTPLIGLSAWTAVDAPAANVSYAADAQPVLTAEDVARRIA